MGVAQRWQSIYCYLCYTSNPCEHRATYLVQPMWHLLRWPQSGWPTPCLRKHPTLMIIFTTQPIATPPLRAPNNKLRHNSSNPALDIPHSTLIHLTTCTAHRRCSAPPPYALQDSSPKCTSSNLALGILHSTRSSLYTFSPM